MARKEYSMVQIVDVLRRYQQGDGIRAIARSTGIDHNTARKYLRMAQEKGFSKDGSVDLESLATEVFRQAQGPSGPPAVRDLVLAPYQELLTGWLDKDQLTLMKAHIKLARMGTRVSYSSLTDMFKTICPLLSRTPCGWPSALQGKWRKSISVD